MTGRRALCTSVAVVLAMGAAGGSARAWAGVSSYAPVCEAPGRTSVVLAARADARPPPDTTARQALEGPFCPPPPQVAEPAHDVHDGALVRRAWRLAGQIAEQGRFEEALLQLRLVEAALPSIADRVALRRGLLALRAGRHREGLAALQRARESLDGATRVRADVAYVRALLRRGAPEALAEFRRLRARYPRLPEQDELWLAHAEHLVEAHRPVHAGYVYRRILRDFPVGKAAREAADALDRLRSEGVRVAPLTVAEQLTRLERLVAGGARDLAEQLAADLRERTPAEATLDQRVRIRLMSARLARWRADWTAAQEHLEAARRLVARARGEEAEHARTMLAQGVGLPEVADPERAAERLEALRGERPWSKAPLHRLLRALDLATSARLEAPVTELLEELHRRQAPARYRTRALLGAVGIVDDERLARWLEPLQQDAYWGPRARYHRARALERLGRWSEAEAGYVEAAAAGGYYALWAEQRLAVVRRATWGERRPEVLLAAVDREALGHDRAGRLPEGWLSGVRWKPLAMATLAPSAAAADVPSHGEMEAREPAPRGPDERTLVEARATLRVLAEAHGEVYPWLDRAEALLSLGEVRAAGDELHEAMLAWRQAVGRPIVFAGLESIYRGGPRRRVRANWAVRRQRARLPLEARRRLAEVAEQLGEVGIAAGLLGSDYIQRLPRPYEAEVLSAARRHGLDPALLWAVMRVESVYQRRIVSYAGAIGLMQIMPRTARAIAWQLGRRDFALEQLLEPAVNLDLAAWYLRSLLDRFEGRLPLAIAAYNGGPHNVRRWMRERPPGMPLDAWLEHIPFGQTWRYVRRVLGHYRAYREQLGLPMPLLAVSMPSERTDPVGF